MCFDDFASLSLSLPCQTDRFGHFEPCHMREGAGDGIAACSWVFLGCVIIPLQPLQGFLKRVFQDAGWGVVPLISSCCALHGVVSRELHSFCRLGEPACETVWVSWWCSSLRNPIQFLSGPSGLFGRLLPKSIEFWMTHTNLDFFHEFHRVSSFQRWSWMTACNAQSIFAFCIACCSPIYDISDIMPIPLSVWSALQSFGTKPWTVEMECCVFPCLHMFAPFGLCQHNNILIDHIHYRGALWLKTWCICTFTHCQQQG